MLLTLSTNAASPDAPVRIASPPDLRPVLEAAIRKLGRRLPDIAIEVASREPDEEIVPGGRLRIAHASLARGGSSSPIGIMVAQINPLRSFSLDRIARLFREGDAATWGDLGLTGAWATRAISLYGLAGLADDELPPAFARGDFSPSCRMLARSADVVAAIHADPGGIGIAMLSDAGGPVRAIGLIDADRRFHWPTHPEVQSGHYPFDRFLAIAAPTEADDRLASVYQLLGDFFLSRAGRSMLAAPPHRYIPLNRRERVCERAKLARA